MGSFLQHLLQQLLLFVIVVVVIAIVYVVLFRILDSNPLSSLAVPKYKE